MRTRLGGEDRFSQHVAGPVAGRRHPVGSGQRAGAASRTDSRSVAMAVPGERSPLSTTRARRTRSGEPLNERSTAETGQRPIKRNSFWESWVMSEEFLPDRPRLARSGPRRLVHNDPGRSRSPIAGAGSKHPGRQPRDPSPPRIPQFLSWSVGGHEAEPAGTVLPRGGGLRDDRTVTGRAGSPLPRRGESRRPAITRRISV
jgi:hypothetical protein